MISADLDFRKVTVQYDKNLSIIIIKYSVLPADWT